MDLFHARDRQTYYLVDLIPLQDLVAGLVYLVVQVDQIVEAQVDPVDLVQQVDWVACILMGIYYNALQPSGRIPVSHG